MGGTQDGPADRGGAGGVGAVTPGPAGGLLDVLGLGAVVVDAEGLIVLWSPQAEGLFGYRAEEALGRSAVKLMVAEEHRDEVLALFAQVMGSGDLWAGEFPVRVKDGSSRLLEFRNVRLTDVRGDYFALGLFTEQTALRRVERDLALSVRLVEQSPIGLAVLDTGLRYVAVNAALERLHGVPADRLVGRLIGEVWPSSVIDDTVEANIRGVLATGAPLLDRRIVVRPPGAPAGADDRAWSVSLYRLDDVGGRVLGVAVSVIDVTDRYRATREADRARDRLTLVADASVRIGTTLDLEQTARELAGVAVPELADVAAVDVLDAVLEGRPARLEDDGPAVIRALAVAAAYPTVAVEAADRPGAPAHYGADRLVTRCVRSARPVLVAEVDADDLTRIARDDKAVALLAEAGVHSYLAVPLIARGEVLGALDLKRARNELPFTEDDVVLASELAARAAVCIDNARLYRQMRDTALTLQRSLLPEPPRGLAGLQVASRYQPAGAGSEVGGDWFDVIPLEGRRTALVVGDVMGSGINAATTMGRLRTATQTLARLALEPAELLRHLDEITSGLEPSLATCVYAVYDPAAGRACVATAGHPPPVLIRAGERPRLLDLPVGPPLGVGGVPFDSASVALGPGDRLVLYTDGLVETRDQDIDTRLEALLTLLADEGDASLETTCDRLLRELRHPANHDDVALLLARVEP
ncbi:SpoIIE family protein phosphatase [Streptomyces sp. NPDC046887]|uniref:SpoIIE family protein phosphatase n=1 Tax=Streptomyces sp. NPDC046887 TaxID=3155472 RepID=UPI0033E1C81A